MVLSWLAEIALNFKEQGNSYFKGKRWREAAGFYSQGIDAKPTDRALLEVLHINRAACNLELRAFPHFRLGGILKLPRRELWQGSAGLLRRHNDQCQVIESVLPFRTSIGGPGALRGGSRFLFKMLEIRPDQQVGVLIEGEGGEVA